jgi:hypothetical protein
MLLSLPLPAASAGSHSKLEPDWFAGLGESGSEETALALAFASDGTLLAGGTNSSSESPGGFRASLDPATGKILSAEREAEPTVGIAPHQRGFVSGERRNTSGFVLASYPGNDSRTKEWWNLFREPMDRLDRVAAITGGWTAAAGFINGSAVLQVHNFNGHLEWIVFPRAADSGFRSIAVSHDGEGGAIVASSSRSNSTGGSPNLLVERYDRAGEKVWAGEHPSGRPTAVVTAIATLPDGTSFVAGWATRGELEHPHVPFATQITPKGEETWSQLLALDPTTTDAEARDACAAPDGSVAVVGTDIAGPLSGLQEPRVRVNVLAISRGQAGSKVDVTMDVRFERSPGVEAEACAYGPDGMLYIAGSVLGPGGGRDAFVGRFDLAKLQERIAGAELVQLGIYAAVGLVVAAVILVFASRRPRRARKVRVETLKKLETPPTGKPQAEPSGSTRAQPPLLASFL